MTPMQHTLSRAAMPKRRRATHPLYTVRHAAWPSITARRWADTRGRESSVSTIPELNRTLLSGIWISRARDAPVQPGTPAASRPGRRKATRAILLSQASPGFPARPRSRRTPGSVRTACSRPAAGPPGRCPAGCAGTPLRRTSRSRLPALATAPARARVPSGCRGPAQGHYLEAAHRACWAPVLARSGLSVPVPAVTRSSRPAPERSRRFLPAARRFPLAAELSRCFVPAPVPSPRGRA